MTHEQKTQGPQFSFEEILWTGRHITEDGEFVERSLDFMRTLLSEGIVTGVIDNDYAANLPIRYHVQGVSVEFLPHWGFYRAGDMSLTVPESLELLSYDLDAARHIEARRH
ncbi:MAG: hypothetical protein AAB896_02755 [Patescibacteria group bacterium]